jgi:FAD/FMN-containing dehydrogenase/Fe-S oxidoreductase
MKRLNTIGHDIMDASDSDREIPYNYTSADDSQVVRLTLGAPVWQALKRLRERRVTGRSARLLLRLIGDLFILRRNPNLYQDLIDSPARRAAYFDEARRDLEIVRGSAALDADVTFVVAEVEAALQRLASQLEETPAHQARLSRSLGGIIGADNVRFDPFILVAHATDATDWRCHVPTVVLTPEREDQVAPLLAACAALTLPIIPRGGGTGLTGGAVPLRPGIAMLNTERLDRIRSVRPHTFQTSRGPVQAAVMEVEAGVVTEHAMQAAAQEGWVFATDPTSAWASTVGGNIAENAGGKTAVLWGTALDNLLSWKMALADGRTLTIRRVNHPLARIRNQDVAVFTVEQPDGTTTRIELPGAEIRRPGLGKDITNKALRGLPGLQKEGTDGVITSAEFVLHRAYPLKRTVCLEFFGSSMDEASDVIVALSQAFPDRGEEALQALEHFDEQYVRAIGYRTKAPRAEAPKAVLLIDIVAHDPAQLTRGQRTLDAVLAGRINTCQFPARDAAEAHLFWADRKKMGAIARRTNAFKLNEDIVLPLPALAEFARRVEAFNVAEERVNQEACVTALLAEVEQALRDEPREAERLQRARSLVAAARQALASAADPGEGIIAEHLMLELSHLCTGWEALDRTLAERVAQWRGRRVVVATHMHAGDGNVHVNIPVFSNDRWMMRRAEGAANTMMALAVELGGVVSGEHGIGITKYRFLEPGRRAALAAHRDRLDPRRCFNPGKLEDDAILELVFTPSFNLLELEARILQHADLGELAESIARCIRCGRCKPDCCVASPAQGLFFHPRNKNLGIGTLIEALLYTVQRHHSTRFEPLRFLKEIADHCTICHKCAKPCPVDIDSGNVSVLERRILAAHGVGRKPLATRMALGYLESRSPMVNRLFRTGVLRLGTAAQRCAGTITRAVIPPEAHVWRSEPLVQLSAPMARPSPEELYASLPALGANQALVLLPPVPAATVFYFPGCGSERLFSEVGRAALYLLGVTGTAVILPPPRLCCGYPHHVNAQEAAANRIALRNTVLISQIRRMMSHLEFAGVVVTCGTCKEALTQLGTAEMFGCDIQDVATFVTRRGFSAAAGDAPGAVLYHTPCHDSLGGAAVPLLKELGTDARTVPHCCSEAGTLALSRGDIALAMRQRKCTAIQKRNAGEHATILTNCPSCLQGLTRNAATGVVPRHLAEELARRHGGTGWHRRVPELFPKHEVIAF